MLHSTKLLYDCKREKGRHSLSFLSSPITPQQHLKSSGIEMQHLLRCQHYSPFKQINSRNSFSLSVISQPLRTTFFNQRQQMKNRHHLRGLIAWRNLTKNYKNFILKKKEVLSPRENIIARWIGCLPPHIQPYLYCHCCLHSVER
jgi:hypothetical protein